MKIKLSSQVVFILIICVVSSSAQQKREPRFEDHNVTLYQGETHFPKWIRGVNGNEWRDDLGKLVDPPEINFAGKYFITIHSCGTGCGYYTLTDLSSGRELEALSDFSFGEPTPKTRDGYEYTTELFYRPDSRMLVVQYNVNLKQGKYQCRERVFLFESKKFKPITNTRYVCSKF
jgi:hypothetical protein